MRVREIAHVDVVAQARAVRRRIVVAEHPQPVAPARCVDRPGNDVNLRRVVFAELTVRIRAGGVEISQRDGVNAVRLLVVRQRPLDGQLRFAIAVDRPLRMRLGDRRLDRLAVRRARRREHQRADLLGRHRLEHAHGADDVVPVVLRGLADRLADVEIRREMHDGADLMRCHRRADRGRIKDVALYELAVFHGFAMSRDEVVEDDDAVAGLGERFRRVTPDVAGATGDQHRLRFTGQWKNT